MIDRERVERHLAALDGYVHKLEYFAALPLSELTSSWQALDAFERAYEMALQNMLDVGSHLLASRGQSAAEYREVPGCLARLGMIPPQLAAALQEGAGMRNLLAHRYLDVDHARMHGEARRDAETLKAFAAATWMVLEREE